MSDSAPTPEHERDVELSIIIRLVGGERFLRRCFGRLMPQVQGRPIEVLVPYDSTCGDLESVRALFPAAHYLDMGVVQGHGAPGAPALMHELYDRRVSHGLAAARGKIVALIEDYGAPADDWCDQILAAHRLPHGVIGGAIEQSARAILNWAVYFVDFGRYHPPLPEGPVQYLSDVNVTYKRSALNLAPDTWSDRYNEVTVHWALMRQGVVLWQRPQIVVHQHRGRLSLSKILQERRAWGRVFGYMRVREISLARRLVYVAASPFMPLVLVRRLVSRIFGGQRHRRELVMALPLVLLLAYAWCFGEFVAYVTGREVDA